MRYVFTDNTQVASSYTRQSIDLITFKRTMRQASTACNQGAHPKQTLKGHWSHTLACMEGELLVLVGGVAVTGRCREELL